MASAEDVNASVSESTTTETFSRPDDIIIERKKREYLTKRQCIFYSVLIGVLLAGVIVGVILAAVKNPTQEPPVTTPAPVPRQSAVGNCIPQGPANQTVCTQRGCTWVMSTDEAPPCTFPPGYGYKQKTSRSITNTTKGFRITLQRQNHPSLYGNDLNTLTVDVQFQTDHRLRIRIMDEDEARYQVPKEAVDIDEPATQAANDTRMYDVQIEDDPHFGFRVVRQSPYRVIFDTTSQGLVFSDQYIQLTTRLSSDNVYGFGEHNHRRYRHDMNWKKWAIFTRDVAPVDEWNLYGAQPFYMNVEEDGKANGVLLLNSDAMDVVLQPAPYPGITYHVIGGVLDFYFFLGPSPENVVQQYTGAVGRPLMPPYWAMGFQLSRWNYDNLTHVKDVVHRNIMADIPYDVQYGDIDYMESTLDFTIDPVKYKGLPEFVRELHSGGMRYIIILDHCIGSNTTIHDIKLNGTYRPYSDGVDMDIFMRDGRDPTKYLEGEVWPGKVYYPDFTLGQNVTDWWTKQCDDFYYNWRVEYDALWIDMNEPSNFIPGSTTWCAENKWNFPPYVPQILGADPEGKMFDKTVCMDASQYWGKHYDVHSLYGHSMSITSYNTLREMFPDKRPLVLTRSNFVGSQKYAGHWLGDNQSQWRQIPWSIVGMLEYSIFGFSYIGADICGFWYGTDEEMCQRWHQLGAFYPFARNHNAKGWPDQDPAAFSDEMVRVTRDILRTRYTLLPFLYTLFHYSHTRGDTIVRPLLHEFPTDKTTLDIDRQFLWGSCLMVSPALEENQRQVNAYFPRARWFNYFDGEELADGGKWHVLDTPLDKINVHVRGGHVIPLQEPANNTVYSRRNDMGLVVALDDAGKTATGSLFWDDGESFGTYDDGQYLFIEFMATHQKLETTVKVNNYTDASSLSVAWIDLWGLGYKPAEVRVDGNTIPHTDVDYNGFTKATRIRGLKMNITEDHTVEWPLTVGR